MAPIFSTLSSHLAVQYAILLLAVFIGVELLLRIEDLRTKAQ